MPVAAGSSARPWPRLGPSWISSRVNVAWHSEQLGSRAQLLRAQPADVVIRRSRRHVDRCKQLLRLGVELLGIWFQRSHGIGIEIVAETRDLVLQRLDERGSLGRTLRSEVGIVTTSWGDSAFRATPIPPFRL